MADPLFYRLCYYCGRNHPSSLCDYMEPETEEDE